MTENLNSNHIENDEFNLNNEDSDYKNLIMLFLQYWTYINIIMNI